MTDPRITDLVNRLRAGSLSRRQFMRRAAALGLAAPAAAALPAGLVAAAPRRAALPRRAQSDPMTLVIADNLEKSASWITLDPGWIYEINSQAAMNVVFEPLYHLPDSTKPTEFAPLLAEGMPEISADGKEVIIKLKSGVKFHNTGNEMTADDWVFSWTRLKNIKFQPSFLAIDYWDSVEAVDPLTLKIMLKSPNAALVADPDLDSALGRRQQGAQGERRHRRRGRRQDRHRQGVDQRRQLVRHRAIHADRLGHHQ